MIDQSFIERVHVKALNNRFHCWAIGKTASIISNQTKLHSTRSGSLCSAVSLGLGLHVKLSVCDRVSCRERETLTSVAVQITKGRNNKGWVCENGCVFPGLLVQHFPFPRQRQARWWFTISSCCQAGKASSISFELLGAVWLEQEAGKQVEGWERPGYYPWQASQLLLSHLRRYHRGWRGTRAVAALWGREMPKGKPALREMLLQHGAIPHLWVFIPGYLTWCL